MLAVGSLLRLPHARMNNNKTVNITLRNSYNFNTSSHPRIGKRARRLLSDRARARPRAFAEIEEAQTPFTEVGEYVAPAKSKALVLGGSIAGLTTAAAVSQHFDEVIIFERESSAGLEEARRGVPQQNQPHVFLMGGAKLLEKYIPSFEQDCIAEGAIMWDVLKNLLNYDFGTYFARAPAGKGHGQVIGASRKLVERVIRRRVLEKSKVFLRPSSLVTGLTFSPDGSRVTGVRLKDGSEVMGDLVVDASGRGSHMREWLEEADVKGLVPPETVNSGLQYASRRYRRPADWPTDKLCLVVTNKPLDGRVCMMLPIEHDEWQIVCAGRQPYLCPGDEEGFLEWIRALPTSDIYDAVRVTTPVSPISMYSRTQNMNNHLEKVEMPDGFGGNGGCGLQLQPHLRPGHDRGCTGGRSPGPVHCCPLS
eukprot:jgi/Botrbrau1/5520/Bobra.0023s0008.1